MPNARNHGVDCAKGVAIVMVVLTHTLRGLSAAGLVRINDGVPARLDAAMTLVDLTTFMMLSALYVRRGSERRGKAAYLRARTTELVWVFCMWTIVQGVVKVAPGSLVNTPLDSTAFALEFIRPTSQLWFVPCLLVLTLITVMTEPWRPGRRRIAAATAVLVTAASWGYQGSYLGTLGWSLSGAFVLGGVLGPVALEKFCSAPTTRVVGAVAMTFFLVSTLAWHPLPPTLGGDIRTPALIALGMLTSAAGTVALVWGCHAAGNSAMGRIFARLGRCSMAIFLAHIVFASGARIALSAAGIVSQPLHVIAGTCAGLFGPLALWRARRRLHLTWLFTAPSVFMPSDASSRQREAP